MPELQVTTTIGGFDVRSFHVHEAISEPFMVDLTVVSTNPDVALDSVIGNDAAFALGTGYLNVAGGSRRFEGVCSHAERIQAVQPGAGESQALSTYHLRIVHRIWLLQYRTNHRIFQHLSIPDIVDEVLAEWDIAPTWKVDRSAYAPLEYKCQYGESDYDFLSRILAEAGIAYVLASADGGTELILSDDLQRSPVREWPSIAYNPSPTESAEGEYATAVRLSHQVRHGAHQAVDFDFRNPTFRLSGEAPKAAGQEKRYERYEYRPGSFLVVGGKGDITPVADDKGVARHDAGYGKALAERALAASRTGRRTVSFDTNVIDLAPGVVASLGYPSPDFETSLLVLEMRMSGGQSSEWDMEVRAVFVDDPFRPTARAKKPSVYGVQSATVVGPQGEEIHTDEFGRVRVQFPWDRDGRSDENSSCWIRVSQGWSGAAFGSINLPRVGQEVLVSFLAGDPDQPIVVGRVFNALEPVPYKLPENKTVSAWKTASSPQSGGYNEFKLEDLHDKEFIYIRAQRDLHQLVKRDQTTRIERNERRTVLEDQHLRVVKNKKDHIKLDLHLHVERDRFEKIDGSTHLIVEGDRLERVEERGAFAAGGDMHFDAAAGMVVEAGRRLTLKGPGGFIDIHEGGIDIVGNIVNINSGGAAGSGEDADPTEAVDADEAFPRDTSAD